MSISKPYLPHNVFAPAGDEPACRHRVLIAPPRYIQGDGVLSRLGRYLALVPASRAAVLISAGGKKRLGKQLSADLNASGIDASMVIFQGECSREEAERTAAEIRQQSPQADCVVAVGGGKCVDTGKYVAALLGVPAVICPTLASNDAPCSALSAMYRPDGVFEGIEFYPDSPALVAVDTRIVAEAPVRYLVAGMGDALSTWYEARTVMENPAALTALGTRPTIAAHDLGKLCATTLYAEGEASVEAVQRHEVNESLERVVEANTLLSGIGFESGGLAVSHAVAQGLTVIEAVQRQYLHGEMVAIGLLTQLLMEQRVQEAGQVAGFFGRVGLPVSLEQIGLSKQQTTKLRSVMEVAMSLPVVHCEPFPVTVEGLLDGIALADDLGRNIASRFGDTPYRTLHA